MRSKGGQALIPDAVTRSIIATAPEVAEDRWRPEYLIQPAVTFTQGQGLGENGAQEKHYLP